MSDYMAQKADQQIEAGLCERDRILLELDTLTAKVKRYEEALEFSKMTLEHAIALDYLGEGSTRGMANDAISMIESALNQDDK